MSLFADTALLVLAAGRGTRFGSDKLSKMLHGEPLATHLLAHIAPLAFAQKVIVAGGQPWCHAYERAGFAVTQNRAPERGLSSSLHLALAESSAPNVLVLLAVSDDAAKVRVVEDNVPN